MKLVLLHSPLVGPATWSALAPVLQARGHHVAVADLGPVMRGEPPYYAQLAQAAADAAGASNDKAVLIVHSGAGALVPAVAALVPLAGAVFVDALLPHPGRSWFETAAQTLSARLRQLAADGRLPPWHRWWPEDALRPLLPGPGLFEDFTRDLPSLPLAYFEERAPQTRLECPSAYLQLSEGYETEAEHAESQGWPVARLGLHHLAMLTHPTEIAIKIEDLAARL